MSEAQRQQVDAALKQTMAVAEAIKELKEVPSGHLYARVMQFMTLHSYNSIIDILKRAGLVTETNNLLRWVGKC